MERGVKAKPDQRDDQFPRLLAAGLVALCFIPIVIYLEADAESVPHEWLILKDGFWIIYPLFIMVQIPHAAVIAWFWHRLDHGAKTLALLSIGLLLYQSS